MDEKITREIFDKIVELAALELKEDEAEYIRRQLNDQLAAIAELEAVPLEADTPLAAHGVPYTQQISEEPRTDIHKPFEQTGDILETAPEVDERYFVTPDIPHEDLG
jgi:aspartyl/glutamyl-tRNA(Asn/Gln) amidotransferase C subunit